MINIARGQITISILEKGDTGAAGKDAEFVKLQFYTQEAYVDSNEHLHINISGRIIQVTGNTIKAVANPTKYAIYGMIKHSDIDFDVTINSDGTFRYIDNDAYYEGQDNDPITHIEITFGENGGIIERYTIPVTLIPSATFEIKQATDTEVASIKNRITANETKIANNVKQITNNYSTLNQKADSINSTVTSIKTTVDKIPSTYTTKTEISQTANNIKLEVTNNVADKLKTTGINLKDGQIVATSNNFKVINESGQPTFEIDSKGNLIGSGSARFQGCVSYGKTIITKENFDYYIQRGSYSGLRLDKVMPRIQIGNNEEPVGGNRTYLPQQNLSLPQMFISTVDGDAIMGGMSLGLKKSEWNEICRGFAGNYFYIYNKINPKYPANTISIYGDIAGMPLSYTSYIDIKSGQFLVLKCEIGIEKKSTQECLVWKYVNLGKISI